MGLASRKSDFLSANNKVSAQSDLLFALFIAGIATICIRTFFTKSLESVIVKHATCKKFNVDRIIPDHTPRTEVFS